MATKQGVGIALAFLHELFPTREITPTTGAAWLLAFEDVSDDVLMDAARKCGRDSDRKFFPTAGEMWAHIPRQKADTATAHELLRRIEQLGEYNGNVGWMWPRVEHVRKVLGDAVATAYGMVGPHRLNSDSPTTREIAQRDFAEALTAERAASPDRIALPTPTADTKRIEA